MKMTCKIAVALLFFAALAGGLGKAPKLGEIPSCVLCCLHLYAWVIINFLASQLHTMWTRPCCLCPASPLVRSLQSSFMWHSLQPSWEPE